MINIALLGCGRIGQVHANSLLGIDGARVAAVCDAVPAAADALAERTGAKVMDTDAILADADIDAVVIGTPTTTHYDLIHAAATEGKAIFCEKPIDLGVDRVRACLEVVNKAGALLMGQREPTCLGAASKPDIPQNYGRLNVRTIFYGFMAVFSKPDQI